MIKPTHHRRRTRHERGPALAQQPWAPEHMQARGKARDKLATASSLPRRCRLLTLADFRQCPPVSRYWRTNGQPNVCAALHGLSIRSRRP
jgi:hypothetical protein